MWYKVDFKRLGILFLPVSLRKPRMIGIVHALLAPLISLHYYFIQYRNGNMYKLQHNGQICYLRKALNDVFDSERRIRIVDGNEFERVYIYARAENKPVYLGKMYLRQRNDYVDSAVDFIVQVPVGLVYDNYQMRALIDYYKLAGMRYKIEEYE